jgi:hypothetical protein
MAAARSVVMVLALALGLAACKRPSPEDCEAAASKWFTLIYWDQAEKEIAAAPAAQRDELRKAKVADHDAKLKNGINLAIMQCRGARDFDAVKCMKMASTADQARKCQPPESH